MAERADNQTPTRRGSLCECGRRSPLQEMQAAQIERRKVEPGPGECRLTCWSCGKTITPDPAPRALCGDCAYGGYFGGS